MNQIKKDHDAYYPIIVTQNNFIGDSTFKYNLPNTFDLSRSQIGIEGINMYYSFFNITNDFNNRTFTIGMPEGASYVFYQVVIDEGFYTVESLNFWLQNFSILNNLYLINEFGEFVYYYEIIPNQTYYGIQILLYDLPDTLQAGWTNPGLSLPTTPKKPIFVVGDSNNFGKLIGFSPGSYNNDSQISDLVPQMSPVSSIIVQIKNIDNRFSNPTMNIMSFSVSNAVFGQMLVFKPTELIYVDLNDGLNNEVILTLLDQNLNRLKFLDNNVTINLVIKTRSFL
jgi:hypothetical protein